MEYLLSSLWFLPLFTNILFNSVAIQRVPILYWLASLAKKRYTTRCISSHSAYLWKDWHNLRTRWKGCKPCFHVFSHWHFREEKRTPCWFLSFFFFLNKVSSIKGIPNILSKKVDLNGIPFFSLRNNQSYKRYENINIYWISTVAQLVYLFIASISRVLNYEFWSIFCLFQHINFSSSGFWWSRHQDVL